MHTKASLGLLFSLALALSCSKPAQKPDTFPEVGKLQPADPVFVQSDPASARSCKADADCHAGELCHPGQLVCFGVYPTPRMLNVSLTAPVDMSQCRPINVYFPFDSAELVSEAQTWLDYDLRCLQARGARRVIIEAHCDARGEADYNIRLSQRRAEAVRQYLQQNGLKVPVEIRPLGKAEPIKEGFTERDYAWNRRAEFRFE